MSVTAAGGFVASGVHCGIRKNERRDLALVRSLVPATGAGMFTANRVQAAPVTVCKEHLELAQPQAVVANSGVANAATGERRRRCSSRKRAHPWIVPERQRERPPAGDGRVTMCGNDPTARSWPSSISITRQ